MTREEIRAWLMAYAWAEETEEEKARVVDCIMAQDDVEMIVDARTEKYAGQAWEPGPEAYKDAQGFALSGLYETHDEPHLPTCPNYKGPALTTVREDDVEEEQ